MCINQWCFYIPPRQYREGKCGNTSIHNILKENIISKKTCDQRSEDLNNESQKTLKKAIVEDCRKWKISSAHGLVKLMLWIWPLVKTDYYRFRKFNQNPSLIHHRNRKGILTFMWKYKRSSIDKTILCKKVILERLSWNILRYISVIILIIV